MRLFRTTQYQQRPITYKNTFTACRFFALVLLSCNALASSDTTENQSLFTTTSTSFEEVKSRVFSDPYSALPQYEVSRKHFDADGENLLLSHAKRTLSSNANFIELGTKHKLLQANGICFAGTWKINHSSPYSGLFQARTNVPVIVRASVSLSGTKQRDKRAFGMAIKLFPNTQSTVTENIFLMHSLGGTKTQHVANLPMTNEPALGELPPFSQLLTAYRLESDLEEADQAFSGKNANARFRPVSHLAEVLLPNDEIANNVRQGPYWLKASLKPDTPLVNKDDFRDELSLQHYPNKTLTWVLSAANFNDAGIDKAQWQEIGEMTLTESVASLTCDTKLHFNHPAIK